MRTTLHLTLFQLRTGGRMALSDVRGLVIVLFALPVFLGPDFVATLSTALYPSEPGLLAAICKGALLLVAAGLAQRRLGATGGHWLPSLPTTLVQRRIAESSGRMAAQSPIVLWLLLLAVASQITRTDAPDTPALLGALFGVSIAWPASAIAVERTWLSLPAVAATLSASATAPMGLLVAVVMLGIIALTYSHTTTPRRARVVSKSRRPGPAPHRLGVSRANYFERWSAPQLRSVLSASGFALLPLLAGWAFARNNDLPPHLIALGYRLAIGTSLTLAAASTAELLGRRRFAWWLRSLPDSTPRRLRAELTLLGVCTLPALVTAVTLAPGALVACAPLGVFLGVRALASARPLPQRLSGSAGQLLVEGLLLAAGVAVLPWGSALLLPLGALAYRDALGRERQRLPDSTEASA